MALIKVLLSRGEQSVKTCEGRKILINFDKEEEANFRLPCSPESDQHLTVSGSVGCGRNLTTLDRVFSRKRQSKEGEGSERLGRPHRERERERVCWGRRAVREE